MHSTPLAFNKGDSSIKSFSYSSHSSHMAPSSPPNKLPDHSPPASARIFDRMGPLLKALSHSNKQNKPLVLD